MFNKILKRLKSNRADSIVSAVFFFPLFIIILISGIDYSVYMSNRGQIQGVARDAARTVAIMGGNGTDKLQTPLEAKYGTSKSTACKDVTSKQAKTPIECNVVNSLQNNQGLVSTEIVNVKCTPSNTTSIGQRVSCEIQWNYGGIPGSALTIFRSASTAKGANQWDQNAYAQTSDNKPAPQTVAASSEAEVIIPSGDMVSR